ncbi:hypothetical protein NBT05_17895 [Aquimarina sp. ERC-38]|uniref:hypothetical protein n=1 Tax=Aquimarina sp. ERC-38 TaxID=2949996 RepID=UPI0022486F3F|nr:hypothetical protein [Aquimarina sp. ERC-38]UZO80798.1 hypothetical protein NBT05_17895 [Aquimarina sp. ERC-38]
MVKKLLFTTFSLISSWQGLQAQEIEGRIIADQLQGYAINIINLTQNLGTTNDAFGNFTIPVKVGDSVIFSSVQYEQKIVVINQADFRKQNLIVQLTTQTQELEPVTISNISLSGRLDKDVRGITSAPVLTAKNLGLPYRTKKEKTPAERKLYTATTSASGIPLDLIINLLNGKIKMIKKLIEIEKTEARIAKTKQVLSLRLLSEGLGIPIDSVDDFLYFCEEDALYKKYIKEEQTYQLFEFLQEKAKDYVNLQTPIAID